MSSSNQRNFYDNYARGQQSGQQESFSASSANRIQSGQSNFEARRAEVEGDIEATLRFSSDNLVIASGSTDYSKIATLKDAILELKSTYFNAGGISVKGEKRD
jgi:hypothetical protein